MVPIAPVTTGPPKVQLDAPKVLETTAVAGTKATETPPAKAVTPVEPSERTRQPEIRQRPQPPSPLEKAIRSNGNEPESPVSGGTVRNVEIDPQTNSVIFQSISERTGQVVLQIPTETFLRIRAFADTIIAPPLGSSGNGN